MAHGVDLGALAQADLDQLYLDVRDEVSRRVTIDNAEEQIREINQNVLHAAGIKPGDPWDPMMRTRGGYPKNATVTHGGALFESQIDNNVWEPDEQGDPQSYRWWKNLSVVPEPGKWSGDGVAYAVGDVVSFGGESFRCRQAHHSQPGWTPTIVPALWEPVS